MNLLIVDPRWQPTFLQLGPRSSSEVIAMLGGEAVVGYPRTVVLPHSLTLPAGEIVQVVLKQYCFPRSSWRFWIRSSKARREFENYAVLERLGVRCAQRIACGEDRDRLGRLRHAFILTRTVPNSVTLLDYFKGRDSAGPQARVHDAGGALRRQLADMTRRIHAAAFSHRDLCWRNILVQSAPGQPPQLYWIDCPSGRFVCGVLLRHHAVIKDLASLDRSAAEHCSRVERMRFVKDYLGRTTLDEDGKLLIRRVLAYNGRRRPTGRGKPPGPSLCPGR